MAVWRFDIPPSVFANSDERAEEIRRALTSVGITYYELKVKENDG